MTNVETRYPGLTTVLGEVFESIGNIKLALKDGQVTVDEVVNVIPDEGVRTYMRTLLTALSRLPAEVDEIVQSGPWGMMMLFRSITDKVLSVFK